MIPPTFDGATVTSIGNNAFQHSSVTSVTIPPGVTSIGNSAFSSCYSLASVTIPSSVTSIGTYAFSGCTSLTDVTIPPYATSIGACAFAYCMMIRITIPNGVTSINAGAFSNCYNLASVTIPNSVTSIGPTAFERCFSLSSITIPSSVTTIGDAAFYNSNKLTSAIFSGNAPTVGWHTFLSTGTGFTVYYYSGATGFSSPTWTYQTGETMPSVKLSQPLLSTWLVSNGFVSDADLKSTPHNDGVTLLMNYALNLNPAKNQSASQPKPVVSGSQMSLTYYAGSPGVTYTVQASTDLQNWSTSGVSVNGPDINNRCTATTPTAGANVFMRLQVTH